MIDRIDHLVLTVTDIERTCRFYEEVLGMEVQRIDNDRTSLHFGKQKINLHLAGHEFEPKAQRPATGSADFCLIASVAFHEVMSRVEEHGVKIELGPVRRVGATGPIESIYFRDPDGNLIEIASYLPE